MNKNLFLTFLISFLLFGCVQKGHDPFLSSLGRYFKNPATSSLTVSPCFNGEVRAIAEMPATNSIIVGGDFTQVGPCTGSGVPINQSTGAIHSSWDFSSMNINGTVSAAISDGAGGWYIAGDFTKVGTTDRKSVARIYEDGTLDLSFVANFSGGLISSGSVSALSLDSGNLYIGGSFIANSSSYGSPLDGTTGNTIHCPSV